jgi:ferredoxin
MQATLSTYLSLKKPLVDRNICEGYAVCVGIAPEVFEIDKENKSVVKNPQGTDEQTIQDAINGCPVQAISWAKK